MAAGAPLPAVRSDSGTVPPHAIKRGEPVWGETMTEAMTTEIANTTATKSVDAGGIKNSPENLRDVAARVDQALEAKAGTFEQRAERLRSVLDGITGIELSAHERTRLMLQVAYGDCLYAISTEEGRRELVLAMDARKVTKATGEQNKFLPIVKTIWGRYVEEEVKGQNGPSKTVWKHNRSAEKYASVFRHLLDEKVPLDSVAQYIETYAHKEHGAKLNGIIAADCAKYGGKGKRSISTNSADAEKLIAENGMKAFSTVTKPDFIKATEGAVVIVARVVNGQLELLGDLKVEDKTINQGLVDLANRRDVPTESAIQKAADDLSASFEGQFDNLSNIKEVVLFKTKENAVAA